MSKLVAGLAGLAALTLLALPTPSQASPKADGVRPHADQYEFSAHRRYYRRYYRPYYYAPYYYGYYRPYYYRPYPYWYYRPYYGYRWYW